MKISFLVRRRFEPQGEERLLHLALDGALVAQEQVLGELLGDRGAALDDAAGARIGHDGAERAGDVDAEMLVEAPVLGGEHGLDQVVGQFVERHRMAVLDAAAADLVAVAVEEGDRELGLLQPVLVGGLAECRAGQRQHQHEAAEAHGGRFGQRLDEEPAPPSRDIEPVHEIAVALERLARQQAAAEQAEVQAGIEIEQEMLEAGDEPPLRQGQRLGRLVAAGHILARAAVCWPGLSSFGT